MDSEREKVAPHQKVRCYYQRRDAIQLENKTYEQLKMFYNFCEDYIKWDNPFKAVSIVLDT